MHLRKHRECTESVSKRSNYTEADESLLGALNDEGGKATNRAKETINLRKDGNKKKKKSTANVRAVLLYRKNLKTLLEESASALSRIQPRWLTHHNQGIADAPGPNYFTAVAPPPRYPTRPLCQVCGYWGDYKCLKCGQPYCTIACREVHNDTGCERRLIA